MRALAALCASVVLLAGCTTGGDADPAATDPVPPSPSTTAAPPDSSPSTADVPVAPDQPEQADCYRFRYDELARTTTGRDPVDCAERHNAVTIHVGRLARVADGSALDSTAVRAKVGEDCRGRLARHLGGSTSDRKLSRFHAVWFVPTSEQLDQGAGWYRCDAVAFAASGRLAQLPRPRRLDGVLDRPAALSTYGLCGTAEPGSPRFERVICDRRHSWRAVSTIRIRGTQEYPGIGVVRAAGDDTCRERVRRLSSSPLEFRYGWEWPTRDQWRHGQRHGYCWAPVS